MRASHRWFLSVALALQVAWIFSTRVEQPLSDFRIEQQSAILQGSAPEPYRFRLLIPFLAHVLSRIFEVESLLAALDSFPQANSHVFAFLIINWITITLVIFVGTELTKGLGQGANLSSALLISGFLNVGLYNHGYQPWSLLELLCWAALLLMIRNSKDFWLPVLSVLAVANRETGLLIPLAYLVILYCQNKFISRYQILNGFLSFAIVVSIYVGIRNLVGSAPSVITIEQTLFVNLSTPFFALFVMNLFMMLAVPLLLALKSTPNSEEKSWLAGFMLYIPLFLIFGIWAEVRLIFPLAFMVTILASRAFSVRARD